MPMGRPMAVVVISSGLPMRIESFRKNACHSRIPGDHSRRRRGQQVAPAPPKLSRRTTGAQLPDQAAPAAGQPKGDS